MNNLHATASTRAPSRSSYSVLLLQKLLDLRDSISPLTLVLDTVESPGGPVLEEFMIRAKRAGTMIVYVHGFLALYGTPPYADVVLERRKKTLAAFRDEILDHYPKDKPTLIVIDSLSELARRDPLQVAAFASSLASPTASVLGLYHVDTDGPEPTHVPVPVIEDESSPLAILDLADGKPPPLRVLSHLATAVLRVEPLYQAVARKRARDRSQPEPTFDSIGRAHYGSGDANPSGVVSPAHVASVLVEMELRRRSGRAVAEHYVLGGIGGGGATEQQQQQQHPATPCSDIVVMAEHPLFAAAPDPMVRARDTDDDDLDDDHDDGLPASTFNLGLTEKQRRDRAGVVLPYFDAQTNIGGGEGGRILYDIGREDDFDDEEDEI